MKQIQNKDLAELLMQVRFAPPKRRRRQVECAEQLLDIIERDKPFDKAQDKEYPFEFVCFKITGFRPKGDAGRRLIKGNELAEDLRLFIWKLSGQVAASTSDQGEGIYTTRQLAEKLRVSTKTIDRWRRRGLQVRKFVFDDGRKRLGFSQSVVDKFLNKNPKLVEEAEHFTRLSAEQKRQIIKRAGALSSETKMSRRQIIRKIAAELGRGQETIRCVLLGYEKSHPSFDSLRKAGGQLNPAETVEVDRLQKQGVDIRELMSRFGRSKSSIYRILKQRRIQALLAKKIEFIRSDEFVRPDAEERILGDRRGVEQRGKNSHGVSPMLRGQSPGERLDKNAPALNRQEEMELFRRYNYLKYRAFFAREQIVADFSTRLAISPQTKRFRGAGRAGSISSARLEKIEKYLAEAEAVKKTIIETNMRLVVSVANRHTITGTNIGDLVSEGNVSLMQAVEKFDYTKGFRFSTYATWAISKDFAHRIPGQKARADRTASGVSEFEEELKTVDVVAVERARHDLIRVVRDNLEPREQLIIINHFGLEGTLVKKNKKTLKQIGDELGLSKERVRQIELVCLQKLRQSLSPEQFDLLMG